MHILRHRFWYFLVLVVLAAVGYGIYAWRQPLTSTPTVTLQAPVPAPAQLSWPATGQAAIGSSKLGVLNTHGPQQPSPTASNIKLLVALSVLKVKPLSAGQTTAPVITIGQPDIDSYNKFVAEQGSVVPVNFGEQLSEYQALQALLLPSANNMAETLARWAFGSLDAYYAYANKYATQLGLTDTHVADASGFSPQTVSTAHDLLLLGNAAIQNPVIAGIVAQTSTPFPVAGTIHNTNVLLDRHGIVGIKTGNTDQAGGTYTFAAPDVVGGSSVVITGAVMDAPNLLEALQSAVPLLKSARAAFTADASVTKHQVVGNCAVPWAEAIAVQAADDVPLLRWPSAPTTYHLTCQLLTQGAPAGTVIGQLTITTNHGKTIATTPVIAAQAVPAVTPWWRLTHGL